MAKVKFLEFLEVNYNGETGPSNLLETTKAYLRGIMVSYCASRKKENNSGTEKIRIKAARY